MSFHEAPRSSSVFSLTRQRYIWPSLSQVMSPAFWSSLKWWETVDRERYVQLQTNVKAFLAGRHAVPGVVPAP